jgi:ABC-type microcin C transport system permease subunit YejB
MRRVLVLGTVMGIAAVSMVVSGQAPTGPSARAIEATKIEKVKDNLYVITGSSAADQTGVQRRQHREYRVAPRYKGDVVTIAEGFVSAKGNLQMAYDELMKK